jgi:hypothetical protein
MSVGDVLVGSVDLESKRVGCRISHIRRLERMMSKEITPRLVSRVL